MWAALGNGVKRWFSLIDKVYHPGTLHAGWEAVRKNRGAAGVDRMSIAIFEAQAEKYLGELETALRTGNYQPDAVRRVEIPKADGKLRPLGIPTVKDRVVQAAVRCVIEPIFEHSFMSSSYGFRPGKGAKDALREVDRHLKAGLVWVVDADIQAYFDSIPHDKLMMRLEERISDGKLLKLIESFLHQDIVAEAKCWKSTSGTPQGAVLSPLLANLYLHPLDVRMAELGYRMVRYADDFVIHCESEVEAQAALLEAKVWMDNQGLRLHPEKTRLGNAAEIGQGFEFLGYRFEAGRRMVRRKSLQSVREKIRSKTGRRRSGSLTEIIEELNPMLRGWFEYFKHVSSDWIFQSLDGMVRRRLRAMLSTRAKRPCYGKGLRVSRNWSNNFFAEQGLFTLKTAHALASPSRRGNH
jgi:RNA-directed DNA polymerase